MNEFTISSGEEDEPLYEGLSEQNKVNENMLALLGLNYPSLKLGDDDVDKKVIEMQQFMITGACSMLSEKMEEIKQNPFNSSSRKHQFIDIMTAPELSQVL